MSQPISFTNPPTNETEMCRCGEEANDHWEFTFAGKTRSMCPEAEGMIVEIMVENSFAPDEDDRSPSEGRAEAMGYGDRI